MTRILLVSVVVNAMFLFACPLIAQELWNWFNICSILVTNVFVVFQYCNCLRDYLGVDYTKWKPCCTLHVQEGESARESEGGERQRERMCVLIGTTLDDMGSERIFEKVNQLQYTYTSTYTYILEK